MKNQIITTTIALICAITMPTKAFAQDTITVKSPDGGLSVKLSQITAQNYLTLYNESGTQLTRVLMGMTINGENLCKNLQVKEISNVEQRTISYETKHGKRKNVTNEGNFFTIYTSSSKGTNMNIEVAMMNDGLAFRYIIPESSGTTTFKFTGEQTCYDIPTAAHRWLQPESSGYEGDYPYQKSGGSQNGWNYPALFEYRNTFFLITEANTSRMYCATHLDNRASASKYKVTLALDNNNVPEWTGNGWTSPWRVVIAGGLNTIVESTLVEDMSDECTMESTDFVHSGSAAWVYWAYNHGTKDYQICRQYVDLAAEMGWTYVLFDWEWDVMGNGGGIEDAVAYAISKGIKPCIWYNSSTAWTGAGPLWRLNTHESRVKEFKWLNSIGVVGVKIDFFDGDKQATMKYYLDILEDAAQYGIMVNFHGATIPRGWSRTYPHLMTIEAVYGGEYYNNDGWLTNEGPRLNCTLPYTRNVVGPMDYTPVAFTDSQHPHTTTYAHELALSIAFESGIQHWADRPSGFYDLPYMAKKHMEKVPTAWDETRFVGGYPGKSFIVARRKGDTWYVGGLQGESTKATMQVPLDFLGEECIMYAATIIKDGKDDKSFAFEVKEVSDADILSIDCLGKGGFVIKISSGSGFYEKDDLEELYEKVQETLDEAEDNIGINSGSYNKEAVEELHKAYDKSLISSNPFYAYEYLLVAYSNFLENGKNAGGLFDDDDGWTDVTTDYLLEKREFSRTDEPTGIGTTRFGLLADPWIVTENIINQDNYTHGGFDSFDGGRAISIEKWNGGENAMVNDKIYQVTKEAVPAGTYHLHISVSARFGLDNGACLLRVARGEEFPDKGKSNNLIAASYDMSKTDYSGDYDVCEFTLTEDEVLSIGWLLNIPKNEGSHAFRVTAIHLIDSNGDDVSEQYLDNYQNIQRKDYTYRRFGIPEYWEVENFNISNGNDGVKQGIDRYPGFNCLMLGVWDDSNRAKGDLTSAKLYRTVSLPAGYYRFSASYNAIYNLTKCFMYAAKLPLTADETKDNAIAFYSLGGTPESDDFYGIEFLLKEDTEICLGWNADLTTAGQQEFRAKAVKLLWKAYEKEYEDEDVNRDGSVNSLDVLKVYKFMQTLTGSEMDVIEDVNKDNAVNSLDVLKVYKYMQSH